MTSDKTVRRRRYDEGLKSEVLAECEAPGSSVAQVAMARGINANVVHRWRQLAREAGQETAAAKREFVPVALGPVATPGNREPRDIEIELRRGAVAMKVLWPVSAASDFAAWARELLR
jgi:transposase